MVGTSINPTLRMPGDVDSLQLVLQATLGWQASFLIPCPLVLLSGSKDGHSFHRVSEIPLPLL